MNYCKKHETNQVMNVTRNIFISELSLQYVSLLSEYMLFSGDYYIFITNLFYCYHCFIDSI